MKKVSVIIFIIAFVSLLLAEGVFTEYNAIPSTDRVTISWITKSENEIKHFLILRSSNDKNYMQIHKEKPTGPGSRYEFVDQNVMFRGTSHLFYKIRAVDATGHSIEEHSMLVHPNVSGIYQTWGAIKAMFR